MTVANSAATDSHCPGGEIPAQDSSYGGTSNDEYDPDPDFTGTTNDEYDPDPEFKCSNDSCKV